MSGVAKEGNYPVSNHGSAESPGVSQRGLTGQASHGEAPNQNRFSTGSRAGPSDYAVMTTKGQGRKRGGGVHVCTCETHSEGHGGGGGLGDVTGQGAPP